MKDKKAIGMDFLESAYVHRMHEYEKELAAKRLLVFLAKLGIKAAQKQLPYGEYITIDIVMT